MLAKGKILKGVGGFYYVLDADGNIHESKARGRFRKDGITPLPGDNVDFVLEDGSYGFIEEILPRKNVLTRPRVANVDMAAIVISAGKPKIDPMLCDKLLVAIKKEEITPLMLINKCDTADEAYIAAIEREYQGACDTLRVSAKTGLGLDALKQKLDGKCTCFAGQSAAGKSSILNALFPALNLQTGGLAKKTARGKHTTRHAELLLLDGFSGTVVDTPGFSFFDSADISPEALCDYYDDMSPYADDCRFTSCLHANEPDCGVKDALSKGKIDNNRYERYRMILKELQEKRARQYD